MKNLYALAIPLLFLLFFAFGVSNCSIPTESVKKDTTSTGEFGPIVRKPNIYIYPTQNLKMTLKINFPNGGRVIESIPNYDSGWNINVDTTGLINNRYPYLYYEATAPDLYQYEKGWVVQKNNLSAFFKHNLQKTGFSEKEISDFIAYWIPVLKASEYYAIYPQYREDISSIVQIEFSSPPDNLLRLFYVIKECDPEFEIDRVPEIPEFNRAGFYVVEWGVIYDGNSSGHGYAVK